MSKLELQSVVEHNLARVRVSGELDLEASPDLLAALRAQLADGRSIEVDLADVDYIDSSGVAVLIHGYKLARKRGLEFALRDPSARVRSVLELSQLQEFFVIRTGGDS